MGVFLRRQRQSQQKAISTIDVQDAVELMAEFDGFSGIATPRQICDLELLLSGGFSPLQGFMNRADYESVCHNMRLTSGLVWPMPITLDVKEQFARSLKHGSSKIALRDPEGVMLAVLHVEEVWQPDRKAEAESVFKSTSTLHPGADYVLNKSNPRYVGGRLEGTQAPSHYDFRAP